VNKRASLVQAIQNAGTFADQALAVSALDNFDRMRREAAQQSREWDAAGAVVDQTLTPVSVYERHTAATDWIGDLDTSGGNYHADMCAEASVWYGKVHPMVKADADEFAAQARGMARRTAGKYGESFDAAAQTFLDYAAYLRSKEAASGLPQIDQEFDPKDNPSETPLPTDVFDTFQPPVHPVNEGVDGPRDDSPLIDEIMANPGYGQGPEKPGGHSISFDESGSYAEVPLGEPGKIPTTAALEYDEHRPTLAIGYMTNLDDIQSELGSGLDFPDARTAMKKGAPFAGYSDFAACVAANQDKDDPEAYCGSIKHKVEDGKKESASSLPTQHQTVDPNNTPTPQADTFNTEVAFPLNPAFETQVDTEELPPAENVAQAKRRAFVAGLLTRAPQSWSPVERAEVADYLSKAAGLTKKADEFSAPHDVPGSETPVSNSPQTTPQPAESGGYGKGKTDGAADKAAGEAPTFSDASSGVSDYVKGYSEGYGGQQEAAGAPDVPASMGGDSGQPQNASDAQGAAQVAMAAKTAAAKPALLPQLVREASMSTPDFIKGFNFARRWKPGQRLVSTGSAEFEEGLYAGITENRVAQASWVAGHRKEAKRLQRPELMKRISAHERATRRFARRNPAALVRGFYVQAATSTDLITTGPGTSPDPMGGTPINGPGTPPPMEGGTDPARPGGPAPYNGAPPFGSGPVAPDPVVGPQQSASPVTPDNELPGYPSAEQRQAAFRTVVQANINKIKQEA
jgi:hypothetical protein